GTAAGDTINGLAGNDTLVGLDGNDTLDGGAGIDSMDGGAGDDAYFVDNSADIIVEVQNAGFDVVRATASYTLPAWVNDLVLVSGAINGTGNAIENQITGNDLANVIDGAGGVDTLTGGGGADSFNFTVA